jgi:hypothetical protein
MINGETNAGQTSEGINGCTYYPNMWIPTAYTGVIMSRCRSRTHSDSPVCLVKRPGHSISAIARETKKDRDGEIDQTPQRRKHIKWRADHQEIAGRI